MNYVQSLGHPSDATVQTGAGLVTDPVCGMKVRATADSPHETYEGHTYYFCSERCRDAFEADPSRFDAR